MLLVEKFPFSQLFFSVIQPSKISFTIIQNEKTPLQAIKTKSSKSHTIDIFSNWLTHAFGPKMTIFPTFFVQAIQAKKMSFTKFQNKKTLLQAIKRRSSKSHNLDIFRKGLTHGFGAKMAIFQLFFLGNKHQENVFYNILER